MELQHGFATMALAYQCLEALARVPQFGGRKCFQVERHIHVEPVKPIYQPATGNGETEEEDIAATKKPKETRYFMIVFLESEFKKKFLSRGDEGEFLQRPYPTREELTYFIQGYVAGVKDGRRGFRSVPVPTVVHK